MKSRKCAIKIKIINGSDMKNPKMFICLFNVTSVNSQEQSSVWGIQMFSVLF